jgi:hypothetical protein
VQIYLYIVLCLAVVVIAVVKSYGLGYSRGFDKGKSICLPLLEDKRGLIPFVSVKEVMPISGNSQEGEIPYLEDTNYQPGDNPEYFR